MSFAVRIARVRFKDGSQVAVLPNSPDDASRWVVGRARDAAKGMSTWTDVRGQVTIWWDRAGTYAIRMTRTDAFNPIPDTLLPSYVHDLVLRELIEKRVKDEIRDGR